MRRCALSLDIASRALFVALPLIGLVAGCAVTAPQEINERYREAIDYRRNQYSLKPGDSISLKLYGFEDSPLNQDGVVLPDGRSDLFFLHNHRMEGKSPLELESEFRASIKGPEVKDVSEVSVQVIPAEESVYLYGQFERPSVIPLKPAMTLREAISFVRGWRITADSDYALLIRQFGDPMHPERFRIDLNDISEELYLLPGDQVYLQRNFFATIVAYLREYIFGVIPSSFYSSAMFL